MNRERLYQGYHGILTMALTWAITLVVNEIFQLRIPMLIASFFVVIGVSGIFLFDFTKKYLIRYIAIFSVLPIILLLFWISDTNIVTWTKDLFQWYSRYDGSEELYIKPYAYTSILLLIITGSILLYYIIKHNISKMILALLLFVGIIILSINEIRINKLVVGVVIFYILTILVEICGALSSKGLKMKDKRAGILYLTPICLLLAIMSTVLPSKKEPIQWEAVRQLYENVKEQVYSWKTDFDIRFGRWEDEFSISMSGYSEDNGEIQTSQLSLDENVALLVSDSFYKSPVYLLGYVSDQYTGKEWIKSSPYEDQGEEEYILDYLELVYGLSRQGRDAFESNQYVKRRQMCVQYHHISTKTFFYPLKSRELKEISGKKLLHKESANITFDDMAKKGVTGEFIFYDMNLKGDAFIRMLRDNDKFSYQTNTTIDEEALSWVQSNIMSNDTMIVDHDSLAQLLANRAAMIKEQYTRLPERLPDRVKELALEITKDYDTSYDKLKALEQYLKSYSYTIYPGKYPKDRDFVDYFIFDGKAGYCTAFASSMAILGRCIGIPTRYVSGFIVNIDDKFEGNLYEVRNSQAHAWTEAYMEGIGWIPFEATPGYEGNRYREWKENKGNAEIWTQNPIPSPPIIENSVNEVIDDSMEDNKDHSKGLLYLAGIGIVFLTIVISIIVIYMILNYRYISNFQRADYGQKMYIIFIHILYLLKLNGYEIGQQETVLMLADRLNGKFDQGNVKFKDIVFIFMGYRYGGDEVTKESYDIVQNFLDILEVKQRAEHNKLEVWFRRFQFISGNLKW